MLALNGRLGSRKVAQSLLARHQSTATATAKDAKSIQIPIRIERGPTDVLRALASTVGRDPTAAHYKYHDDPYFIPTSNVAKRTYALAQESGRKAALWIRQEHSDLYDHRIADPVIQDFLPRAVYNEDSNVTENTLQCAIQDGQLSDAMTIYRLLNKDSVSLETKQALFELLCFANDEELINNEFTEERWFTKSSQRNKPKWKSNELTEELFTLLKNENDAAATTAYNAMICGTAKFLQVEEAWTLYNECLDKGLPLCVRSFNSILNIVQYLKDNGEQRRELMMNILQTMARQNVRPNLGTLNSALQVAIATRAPHPGRELALAIYKEMTNAGVEPSIGTYAHLITVFCRSNGPRSQILVDILDKIEGQKLEMRDTGDLSFFVRAMEIAKNHLINPDSAHRIHKLLLTGNNYDLIGGNHLESIYYRHYLTLIVQTQPLDQFIALYDLLVPNVYIPEPDVMDEILQAIELAGAVDADNLLPRIWSNMVMFDHVQRPNLTTRVLRMMHTECSPAPESPVNKQYADIAWQIWTYIEDQSQRYRSTPLKWTGEMLGQVAVLSIRGEYFDRVLSVLSYLKDKEGTYSGVVSKQDLDIILDACIENGHAAAAVNAVAYAVNNAVPDTGEMGYKIAQSLSLSPIEETKLVNLVGNEVLQANQS